MGPVRDRPAGAVGGVRCKKKDAYRLKATVNWLEVQNDVTAYLRGRGTDEWRKTFVPLMSGIVTDQGKQWANLLGIEFDVRNIEGEAWFQDYTLDFARNCTLRTEEAVKSVIEVGLAEGWSVPNMQDHLTMVFRQWQNGGSTPEEFGWFTERMPAHRTEMIARTETIRASSRGNEQQFARWGVEGKEWLTAHDERLCPWCAEMDGKLVNVTEPFFVQGDVFEVQVGDKLAALHLDYEDVTSPPLHPNCRCTLLPWKREWEEIGVEAPERLEEWVSGEVEDLPPFPDDLPGKYETVRPLGGSTGAALVRDSRTGRQYVMKRGKTPEHIRDEASADAMYRALGVRVPDFRLYETAEGPVKFSEYVENTRSLKTVLQGDDRRLIRKVTGEMQDWFAADALLANWDVLGLELDNILVDPDGHAWRIDNGGGLRFRGMGQRKSPGDFGNYPMELWTMRRRGEAQQLFGSMDWYDVERSMRRVLRNRKSMLEVVPEDLRGIMTARIDSMRHAERTSSKMRRDEWVGSYVENFVFHSLNMRNRGLLDQLPEKLTHRGVQVYDQHKRIWDDLRGVRSTMQWLSEYMNENGGDLGIVESWAGSQGGSSGSGASSVVSMLMAEASNSVDQYYWDAGIAKTKDRLSRARARFGPSFDASYTMWHSFNYEFLQNTAFERNNLRRGVIQVARTEPSAAWKNGIPGVGIGEVCDPSRRGLVSGSIYQTVRVGGSDLTLQEIPHHRIMGSYMFGKGYDRRSSFFYGDSENEFVFHGHGIETRYFGRVGAGENTRGFWTQWRQHTS